MQVNESILQVTVCLTHIYTLGSLLDKYHLDLWYLEYITFEFENIIAQNICKDNWGVGSDKHFSPFYTLRKCSDHNGSYDTSTLKKHEWSNLNPLCTQRALVNGMKLNNTNIYFKPTLTFRDSFVMGTQNWKGGGGGWRWQNFNTRALAYATVRTA